MTGTNIISNRNKNTVLIGNDDATCMHACAVAADDDDLSIYYISIYTIRRRWKNVPLSDYSVKISKEGIDPLNIGNENTRGAVGGGLKIQAN